MILLIHPIHPSLYNEVLSNPITYANVMGFDNTSLYSDGWIGWSNDTSNPTETGEPK